MAATLGKQLQYATGLRELGDFCEATFNAIVVTSNTESGLVMFTPKTGEARLQMEDIWIAQSLRSTYSKILLTNMVALYATQEQDTNIESDWPVAKEFDGVATDDCITFCNSRGLIPCLRSCLEAIEGFFSNRKKLTAELDYFQEDNTEDEGHVVFRLVLDSSQETAFKEYSLWVEWFVTNVRPDDRTLFTLTFTRRAT